MQLLQKTPKGPTMVTMRRSVRAQIGARARRYLACVPLTKRPRTRYHSSAGRSAQCRNLRMCVPCGRCKPFVPVCMPSVASGACDQVVDMSVRAGRRRGAPASYLLHGLHAGTVSDKAGAPQALLLALIDKTGVPAGTAACALINRVTAAHWACSQAQMRCSQAHSPSCGGPRRHG